MTIILIMLLTIMAMPLILYIAVEAWLGMRSLIRVRYLTVDYNYFKRYQ